MPDISVTEEGQRYLRGSVSLGGIGAFVLLYALSMALTRNSMLGSYVVLGLVGLPLSMALRFPRWLVYLLAMLLFVAVTYERVWIDARGPQDAGADRDEAAEIAATRFLRRQNPWLARTQLGNVITTGPVTILLAAPFVAATGHIDLLTFAFWLALATILLVEDLRNRNETWLTVALLYVAGDFTFDNSQHWSLEELSYGCLFMALGLLALRHRRPFLVGIALAMAVLVRASYAFVALGFMLWWWLDAQADWRRMAQTAFGGVATVAAIFAMFWIVLGDQLMLAGPITPAMNKAGANWDEINVVFRALQAVLGKAPAALAFPIRAAVASGTILFAALLFPRVKRISHPYWHAAVGHLAAFFVVAPVGLRWARDYTLPVVILGFLGIAASAKTNRV